MSAFNRPPMKPNCYPQGNVPPSSVGEQDQCAALPHLRAAYYALLAGKQTQQVRDGERWQSFHQGNAKVLKEEIRRLEIMCEQPRKRALRAGPYVPPGALFPPYGYGYNGPWF